MTEAQVRAGGKTIILTLTYDTWVAAGAVFDAQRQAIINGLNSAGSAALGWNNVVRATQSVAGVVRTSATVVTITLDAFPTYDISASETITITVPQAALVLATGAVVCAQTFTVTPTQIQVIDPHDGARQRKQWKKRTDAQERLQAQIREAIYGPDAVAVKEALLPYVQPEAQNYERIDWDVFGGRVEEIEQAMQSARQRALEARQREIDEDDEEVILLLNG
jgi:hypothetical protein